MIKSIKVKYCMSEDEVKDLKKAMEYVKKLDFFRQNTVKENKSKKTKKVA